MRAKGSILIVSSGLLEVGTQRGGGIEEIDLRVAEGLSHKYNIVIIGPRPDYSGNDATLQEGLKVVQVRFPAAKEYPPKSNRSQYFSAVMEVLYLLPLGLSLVRSVQPRPKLLVVHNGFPGLLAAITAKIFRQKLILSEGNTTPWSNPYVVAPRGTLSQRLKLLQILLVGCIIGRLSDRIRVQSLSIKDGMAKRGIDPDKIEVIPAGVDIVSSESLGRSPCASTNMRVGFVGRLSPEKGALLLLEIVRLANTEIPEVRFVLLGEGPCKNQFLDFPNIEYLGWVPRQSVASRLADVDVVLFCQRDIGLAELQSMALKKAIVACNLGGVPGVFTHMHDSLLCTPDAKCYVEAIKTLVRTPNLAKRLGDNAGAKAIQVFAWDIIIKKWESLCSIFIE